MKVGTLVSVGNATQPFKRLVDAVERQAAKLPQPILVQYGHSPMPRAGIIARQFIPASEFRQLITTASIFITHAGAGSIITARQLGVKPIVIPRSPLYGEHVDGHQLDLAEQLARQEKITLVVDPYDLQEAVHHHLILRPTAEFTSHANAACDLLRTAIRALGQRRPKLCVAASLGGHMTQALSLRPAYADLDHFFVSNGIPNLGPDNGTRLYAISAAERDWKVLLNLTEVNRIFLKEKPTIVLSTGAGTSIPPMIVGKVRYHTTVIHIESVTRVTSPSLSGRIAYVLADKFFYQWQSLSRFFPRGELMPTLL